jgi:hypothetical protein
MILLRTGSEFLDSVSHIEHALHSGSWIDRVRHHAVGRSADAGTRLSFAV